MTLEDLANLGELVGALGVVVSLFYLANQIRQNTSQIAENSKLVRANVSSMMAQQTSQSIAYIFTPGAPELMVAGARDYEGLTPEEKFKFAAVNDQMMSRFESLYLHHRLGLLTDAQWDAKRTTLRRRLAFRGVQQWWTRAQSEYEPEFCHFVTDELLSAHPSPREHPAA